MLTKYFHDKGVLSGEYDLHETINGNKYAVSHQKGGATKLTYFAFGQKFEADISSVDDDSELNSLSEKSTYEEMVDVDNYTVKQREEMQRQAGYKK